MKEFATYKKASNELSMILAELKSETCMLFNDRINFLIKEAIENKKRMDKTILNEE